MRGVDRVDRSTPPLFANVPKTRSKVVHIGHKETRTRTDRRTGGWNFQPSNPPTKHFTANTCPKCGNITITGTTSGIPLHLEPHMLNDQTEYNALHDQVPTYDLWPDRIARRRQHAHITHPTRVPRHAQHTCHTTYGTTPRPTPPAQPHAAPHSDTPPF